VDSPTTSRRPATLGAAIAQWRTLLGDQFVICDPAALRRAGTATFATTASIQAIVRPATRSEVAAAVRVAVDHRVSLYPFSSGLNWGYGSRVPVRDGVLLDLGRLNAIVNFDEDLGVVTIEPGVTQRQLHAFLRSRGGRFWMDATGASPDCSIIGNTMERGFGHTPAGDHAAQACGLEVLLPSGAIIRTGFSRFQGARTAHVSRWGVGPSLDGLFSQSNLGIVTRMTVWLMPAPEYFQAFFFMARDDARLEPLVDVLRRLRLEATLRSAVHLANDYKVAASLGQYPWNAMAGDTPLSAGVLQELARRRDFGAWNGSGALYGTRDQVGAARRRIKALLRPHVDKLRFIDDRTLGMAARVQRPYRWVTGTDLAEVIELVRPVYELMKGVPTSDMLRSTYWRKRIPPPPDPDPDRDRCGLIWCTPVSPAEPRNVRNMVEIVHKVFARHAFEPAMSMTLRTERSVDNIVSIAYDRDVPGEDARAMQCHDELLRELTAADFYPYRLGIHSIGKVPPRKPSSQALLGRLKAALDPDWILAPGRYD
jgi:4-cresol dehydrogenase (hydroxylating)